MGNALSSLGGPPPAPNPIGDQTAAASPMGGSALTGAMPSAPAAGAPQQAPAPSHQQTVAALRHFGAIESELKTILADPDLGKADLRDKIIDGATKLVADRILKPNEAVVQLGNVPDKPFDQKKWVEQQYVQTVMSANAVLDHHRAAAAEQGPMQQHQPYNSDNHLDVVSGLIGHYNDLKSA